jgi:hypothetical protein
LKAGDIEVEGGTEVKALLVWEEFGGEFERGEESDGFLVWHAGASYPERKAALAIGVIAGFERGRSFGKGSESVQVHHPTIPAALLVITRARLSALIIATLDGLNFSTFGIERIITPAFGPIFHTSNLEPFGGACIDALNGRHCDRVEHECGKKAVGTVSVLKAFDMEPSSREKRGGGWLGW